MDDEEFEYFKSLNYLFESLRHFENPNSNGFQNKLNEIRDTPIYKFMSLDHVKLMIQNQTLWISKVNTWDDVYENIFFKQNFFHDLGNGLVPVGVEYVGNNMFGQCWTSQKESDAMWRIYSPDKNNYALRIKTTVGKLMDAAFVDPYGIPTVFVGEVSYVDDATISGILSLYAQNGFNLSTSAREYAELLLLKRKEFEHEREIRLIISKDTEYQLDHVELGIDSQTFIDEITLDSRMVPGSTDYNHYKSELLSTGISSGKINRSTLYDLPAPVNITIA